MTNFKTAALSAVIFAAAGMANATTVDFAGFASGDILGAGTDLGGGVVADISAIGGIAQAVIFDTNNPTGGDTDLASPFTNSVDPLDSRGFGNALIVQENPGDPIVPDDVVGGTLIFSFGSNVSIGDLFLLDTEEESFVSLLLGGETVLTLTVDDTNQSDTNGPPNAFTALDFGGAIGDQLVISFSASGALGEFDASPVPLPAGLPLLLGGIGAFAWMKRRKKA